jgi:Kdo2-lipid IVA lauroyltransferase/acyltransferase
MQRKASVSDYIVAGIAIAFFTLFRILPIDQASGFGGWLARHIGPRLKWHRTAAENLRRVWPDKPQAELDAILIGMWDNLGRTMAEYAWLNDPRFAARIAVPDETHEHIRQARELQRGLVFAAGHLGNWEVAPLAAAEIGVPLVLIYRRANNPLLDRRIRAIRRPYFAALYPKGRKGAAGLLKALSAGSAIGMLVDQKMNNGIELPFLGLPSMTAPATAELALKYGAPIILARVIRHHGAHFTMQTLPVPIENRDTHSIMAQINTQLTEWIFEHPEQWLWIHRRWGK